MKELKQLYQEFKKTFLEARRADYSIKEIKEKLLQQGYDEHLINSLILKYYFKKSAKITIFILFLVILLMLLTYFLMPEACDTPSCFVKAANECDPKIYEIDEAGSIIRYQITADCYLIKKALKIADTEPQKIRDMFLSKLMVCSYPDNKFNPEFFKLAWGLEYCEGPLKDAILAILSAVCPEPCEESLTTEEVLQAASAVPFGDKLGDVVEDYFPYWLFLLLLILAAIVYRYYKKYKEKKEKEKKKPK